MLYILYHIHFLRLLMRRYAVQGYASL